MSKKNKQLRKITKKAVRKAFKQYWRLLFPPNFFTKEDGNESLHFQQRV
jgi:hypothetical protein